MVRFEEADENGVIVVGEEADALLVKKQMGCWWNDLLRLSEGEGEREEMSDDDEWRDWEELWLSEGEGEREREEMSDAAERN